MMEPSNYAPRRAVYDVEAARKLALDPRTPLGNDFDRTVIATLPNAGFYPTNNNGSGMCSHFEDPNISRASGVLLMKFVPEATALKQCCLLSNCGEQLFQDLLPTTINQVCLVSVKWIFL